MNEARPDGTELVSGMAEADDSVHQNTRELVWWSSFAVITGLLIPSGYFLAGGVIVLVKIEGR